MECHYIVLGVPRTADSTELKKAYRRKALELHPDKNPDRIEECTRLFARVQNAYATLSDPHERAWYDSHRESILNPSASTDAKGLHHTPTAALMQYFSASAYADMTTDATSGFFGVYGQLFRRLLDEEQWARSNDSEASSNVDPDFLWVFDDTLVFGDGDDEYPEAFYSVSNKSFRWHDKHNLATASDRQTRRLMQSANAKLRSAARKEFNSTVRELALFVQKRDPRYIDRLNRLKEAKTEKSARNREQMKLQKEKELQKSEVWEEQEWSKIENTDVVEQWLIDEAEVELQDFYCAACNKQLKSEQQWKTHENSVKHKENVERLRQELLEEDLTFQQSDAPDSSAMSFLVIDDLQPLPEADLGMPRNKSAEKPTALKSKTKKKGKVK
ncbi:hypothetical protein HDU84_009867 [Entophlyctis sp. JEL0112]|nr:hypothetical protein HDU84_009867 [Entophlyctis sp. JEL0112]